MAYRFTERDFHLTESGWTTNDVPVGSRVESWRFSLYQESSWSKEQRSWTRIWRSLGWSDAERERLRRAFPPPATATLEAAKTSAQPAASHGTWASARRAAG